MMDVISNCSVDKKEALIKMSKNIKEPNFLKQVYDDVKQLIKHSLILETSNRDLQKQLDKVSMYVKISYSY